MGSHSTDELSGQHSSQGLQRRRPSFFLLTFRHSSLQPGAMAVKTHLAVPALSSK